MKERRGSSERGAGAIAGPAARACAPGKLAGTDALVQQSPAEVPGLGLASPPAAPSPDGPPGRPVDPFDWRAISGPLVQLDGGGASAAGGARAGDEAGTAGGRAEVIHAAAADGVATPTTALPYQAELTRSFGPAHDLTSIRAHVGGAAEQSARTMGAQAYATGQDVVLPADPSLQLVAHEVTHVLQQRRGVQLLGGVGEVGDPHEREADEVAAAVARGEAVGDTLATGTGTDRAIQRKADDAGAATLPAWVEPQLMGLLRIPVPRGDAKSAKMRVDAILGTVRALHRPMRKVLLGRLATPRPGDELAELFTQQLSRGSRQRVLEVLRDATPARTEAPEDQGEQGEEGVPAAAAADEGDAARGSGTTAATGTSAMWRQIIGERSTPVGKMARVRAERGVRLRVRPAADEADVGIMPFDELVQVERRTDHGWCWVVSMGAQVGKTGFCEEAFLSLDPPEPTAHLHRVKPGDTLGDIAGRYYGKSFRGGNDARLYVQALYEANKDHQGVYLDKVDLGLLETWHRRGNEEKTLEIYRGAKVREGLAIWVPSEAFIHQLRAAGALTSGSSELSKAWRTAKDFVDDAVEAVKYAAGFTVGLLQGAWGAIVDLFQGAADMIEAVAKVVYHLVTGNPGAIRDMLMGWVRKLKLAWANRAEIADDFMKKWEADDGWDRGLFQGEVLGWVMMTALIVIVTAGEAALPMIAGRWANIVRILKAVDALGDVTTYAAKAGKLPGKAYDHVRGKLGKGAEAADAHAVARGVTKTGEGAAEDGAKRGRKDDKPGPEVRSGVAEDPGALMRGADLEPRQLDLLARLGVGSSELGPGLLAVGKREVTATDLAALTRHTGNEHALVILRDNKRVLVDMGSYSGGNLPAETKILLMHSHPHDWGTGAAKLISQQDVRALMVLNQRYSYMVTVDGTVYRFTMNTVPNSIGDVVRQFHPVLGWVSP
ncbi:MAG: DUF4157 domain-containing protein [Kofleriaceae bacterium]|nr:DUF4157 domain-containing protein [Kofleriaceae bacterium]MCL4223155.1 LysM peptidoglycan-binding domain-containing protein [Myxococcales bacterium]